MQDEKSDLFLSVLRVFQAHGLLEDFILVGSWCHPFYRSHFQDLAHIPLIRTSDVDFLIPNPKKSRPSLDVPALLKELGFSEHINRTDGVAKYQHPDLDLEFLAVKQGRGEEQMHEVKPFQIRAQSLRYLELLQSHVIRVPYRGIQVQVPEPSVYVLHKLLINPRRDEKKQVKDLDAVREIASLLLQKEEHRQKMKAVFDGLPSGWKSTILRVSGKEAPEVREFLGV